jgi:hypothetical protein
MELQDVSFFSVDSLCLDRVPMLGDQLRLQTHAHMDQGSYPGESRTEFLAVCEPPAPHNLRVGQCCFGVSYNLSPKRSSMSPLIVTA